MHGHLRRLPWIRPDLHLFFVSTVTYQRQSFLTISMVASILIDEWRQALPRHGWKTGRYVIMPDHVHFFCSPSKSDAKSLSGFMQGWKQWTGKRIIQVCGRTAPVWQAEFFDHLVRSEKSYSQKMEYLINNPIRAGLVQQASEWPWQGEIYPLTM
jgi:putative transposase